VITTFRRFCWRRPTTVWCTLYQTVLSWSWFLKHTKGLRPVKMIMDWKLNVVGVSQKSTASQSSLVGLYLLRLSRRRSSLKGDYLTQTACAHWPCPVHDTDDRSVGQSGRRHVNCPLFKIRAVSGGAFSRRSCECVVLRVKISLYRIDWTEWLSRVQRPTWHNMRHFEGAITIVRLLPVFKKTGRKRKKLPWTRVIS